MEINRLRAIRAQFAITRHRIYFDIANMATPPVGVTNALASYFAAIQESGGDKAAWMAEIEATRRKAAALLECDAGEIAFVKNTSEGLNIAANSIAWRPGDNVVIPVDEHANNVFTWLNLRQRGVEVRLVPDAGAWVGADTLAPFIDARTRVIAISDVSFYPGQRNDIAGIATLCRAKNVHLVVDGVQAAGLLAVRPRELGITMWAASGHKGLLSPHGVGLFFCRRELIAEMAPAYAARASMMLNAGDDHLVEQTDIPLRDDARRFEIGNHNYAGIHAMGAALDLILDVGIETIERHVLALGAYLAERLAERQVRRLGPDDPARRSAITVFELPGEGWVEYFAAHGIVVSARRGALRVSFGAYNTTDEIDQFIAVLDKRLDR